jgi:hypothetical protein
MALASGMGSFGELRIFATETRRGTEKSKKIQIIHRKFVGFNALTPYLENFRKK